jgi:hypothetical protein
MEKRNAYRNLVGKPLRECPIAGLRRIWEDNIRVVVGR